MNKLGDLLAKKKVQEEEKLNNIKEEIRKELEPEIEKRAARNHQATGRQAGKVADG